jgi:cation transport regulator ChaC
MLHFAYGSNMYRTVMRRHARCAVPIGVARLADHRFIITADGYASVEPERASTVYGVLWKLSARDRATLDRWEWTASGQYRAEILPVRSAGSRVTALVYVGRRRTGRPRAGYMELVIAAARAWRFPPRYIASLQHWLPAQPLGAGTRNLKEFGWM